MGIPDLSDFDRYPFFLGVAKMAISGLCANPTGMGGGVPDGKNEIKEHITPYFGVGEHEFNSGGSNFDPIYHSLTPPGRHARATKTR